MFEDVAEADEKEEADVYVRTQVLVTNSAKETANIEEHLSPNLGNNMNLLFYNFNNSRANTASCGKRPKALGQCNYAQLYQDAKRVPAKQALCKD